MSVRIISDGSCDLSEEFVKENNITIVPFYVNFLDHEYKEGTDIKPREFYDLMVSNKGKYPKSSMPSVKDYMDVFTEFASNGDEVICLCITRKFSGSFNSAQTAKDMILEDYPNARIEVIDTKINTVLQGLIVRQAINMRDAGLSFQEIIDKVNEIKETGRIFFTLSGLDYLKNGGRIGKLSAIIGNILRIHPLIVLKEGEIFSSGMSLTRKKSLIKVKEMVRDHFTEGKLNVSDYTFVVGYGYDIEEGKEFRDIIIDEFKLDPKDVFCDQIGATIGVHTGPYPIGVALIKKYNK